MCAGPRMTVGTGARDTGDSGAGAGDMEIPANGLRILVLGCQASSVAPNATAPVSENDPGTTVVTDLP